MTDTSYRDLINITGVGDGFAVAPDGTIYYTAERDGTTELFRDGTAITDTVDDINSPHWLRERGTVLALMSEDGDTQQDLVEIDPGTGSVTTVLETDYLTYMPRQSPVDPDTIALLAGKDGGLDIYTLDLDTGDMEQVVDATPFSFAYDWSPDGTQIAYQIGLQETTGIRVADLATGDTRDVADVADSEERFRVGMEFGLGTLWGADGILFISNERDGTSDVMVATPDGDHEPLVETPHDKYVIGWRPDGDGFAYLEQTEGDIHLYEQVDGEIRQVTDAGVVTAAGWTPDGDLVYRQSTPSSPAQIWRGNKRVSDRGTPGGNPVTPEYVEFDTHDGMTIPGLLYEPRGPAKGAAVFATGGPGTRVTTAFEPRKQALIAAGYAVFAVAYRGCTGHGRAHRKANTGDLGTGDVRDLASGAAYLRDRGYDSVSVYGHSYGGYLSLMAATTDAFDSAICLCGPGDLRVAWEHTRGVTTLALTRKMGGTPEDNPELYRERSPTTHIADIDIPVLVVQGANDRNVPPEVTDELVEQLAAHDVPHEYLFFEDEGHFIETPENRVRVFERMTAFLG